MIDIGERLRELRKAKGLSQGDIVERLGIFRSKVSAIECGYYVPRVCTLEKWTNVLGISLAQLFTESHESRRSFRKVHGPVYERRLLAFARRLNQRDKRLLVSVAKTMAKQRSET